MDRGRRGSPFWPPDGLVETMGRPPDGGRIRRYSQGSAGTSSNLVQAPSLISMM